MSCNCKDCREYPMPHKSTHRKQRGRTAPNRALSRSHRNKQMQYEIATLSKQVELLTIWCGRMQKKLNELTEDGDWEE